MRVLFVTPALPGPQGGGAKRMYEQLTRLQSAGVAVDLLSYSVASEFPEGEAGFKGEVRLFRPPHAPFESLKNLLSLKAYPCYPGFRELLTGALAANNYDLVHVHKFQMAEYLAGTTAPPVVIDLWACGLEGAWRDALYERAPLAKAAKLSRIPRYYLADRKFYRAFRNFFVVSEEAREYVLRRYPGKRVYVMPHGADIPPARAPGARGGLVYVGDMSFDPNIDAALFLCGEVLPVLRGRFPALKLSIVGRSPAPEVLALAGRPGVEVTGPVEDVGRYLDRAAVFAAPLRSGLGLRTKILEAFAHGVPVVATRRACEGIPAGDGREVLLAETPAEFAARIKELLEDAPRAAAMGERARRLAAERYGWAGIISGMKRAYDEILRHNKQ